MATDAGDDLPPELEEVDVAAEMAARAAAKRAAAAASVEAAPAAAPKPASERLDVPEAPAGAAPSVAAAATEFRLPSAAPRVMAAPGASVRTGAGADMRPAAAAGAGGAAGGSPSGGGSGSAAKAGSSLADREFLTDWGTPEQEALQKQMIDAALEKQPHVKAEREAEERKVTKEFGKGTGLKKGFLLGGLDGPPKKATPKPAAAAAAKPAAAAGSAVGSEIIELRKPAAAAGGAARAGFGGASDPLRLPEVQEALRAQLPAVERKLADGAWMTPDLLEKIARDPRLAAGMANPRWMAAIRDMQKNPAAAAAAVAELGPGFEDFMRSFMGLLGAHFSRLGESEELQRQADAGGADTLEERARAKGGKGAAGGGAAPTPAPGSAAGAKPAAASAGIGLTASTSRSLPKPAAAPAAAAATASGGGSKSSAASSGGGYISSSGLFAERGGLLTPSGPPTATIAEAARAGKLEGVDEEVRSVLANPALVELLRDPAMHAALEECRRDGRAMARYMRDPVWARKFGLMARAGLIRVE